MRTTNLIVLDGQQRHWTLGCSMYGGIITVIIIHTVHMAIHGIRDNRAYNTVRV